MVCIQETKAQEHQLVDDAFRPVGYHCYYNDAEKKRQPTPAGAKLGILHDELVRAVKLAALYKNKTPQGEPARHDLLRAMSADAYVITHDMSLADAELLVKMAMLSEFTFTLTTSFGKTSKRLEPVQIVYLKGCAVHSARTLELLLAASVALQSFQSQQYRRTSWLPRMHFARPV